MTAPAPPPQQAPAPAPVFALPVADAAAAWAALQETGTVEVGGKTITSATVTRPGKANVEDCGFAPTTDLGNPLCQA